MNENLCAIHKFQMGTRKKKHKIKIRTSAQSFRYVNASSIEKERNQCV